MNKLTPIFVGGTGRSGTSIFKRIMRENTRIATIPRELRLLIDPGGGLDLISSLSEQWSPAAGDAALTNFETLVKESGGKGSVKKFMSRIERSKAWPKSLSPARYSDQRLGRYFGFDFYEHRLAQLISDLSFAESKGRWLGTKPYRLGTVIRETSPFTEDVISEMVASCFSDLYSQLNKASPELSHWLDDTPYNLMYCDKLLKTFKGARFIHLYRDPRDVMASYRTKIWGGNDFEVVAKRLAGLYEQWFRIRERLPKGSFCEIALEDLVNEPEKVLRKSCDFCGVEMHENMLQISLKKSNSGRWKKDVPFEEMRKSLPHLLPALKAYGYEV